MKRRISEGGNKFRSPSPSSALLRPCSVPDDGGDARKPLEDDLLRCGGVEEEEEDLLLPLEKQVDDDAEYLDANDREMESDDDGEEFEKDDGEEEDDDEEDEAREVGAMEEEIVPVEVSEGKRAKLAEGFFEVEAIRRKRICKGESQYYIKWRGWPESANTWEPLEHLQLCPDIVEAYEQSLQSGKKTRKRKRKYTQPKKKLQYTYTTPGSKEYNADGKKPRVGRKPAEKKPAYEPSALGSKEPNGDENSSDKDNDTRKITIQLQEAAKGEGSSVNSSSKADSAEPSQGDRRTGARRRKSGSVQRFKPDSVLTLDANSIPVNGSYDSAEQLSVGNTGPYPMNADSKITRILKPIGYSTSRTNDMEDVLVTFVALRSDGKEVVVDNKYLKASYPGVLIEFYEQHLRYSPAS